MALKSLDDLFLDELKDLYHAEKQLVKALPKMAKAASTDELREAFENHLEETENHVARLEQVFKILGKPAKAKVCKAMEGLVEEGADLMEEDAEPGVLDAGLICAAQKVEHYEISAYGTLSTWADVLGQPKIVKLLQATLAEEKAADEKLTDLGSDINYEAEEVEQEVD